MTLAALLFLAAALISGQLLGFVALGWLLSWAGIACVLIAVVEEVEIAMDEGES